MNDLARVLAQSGGLQSRTGALSMGVRIARYTSSRMTASTNVSTPPDAV